MIESMTNRIKNSRRWSMLFVVFFTFCSTIAWASGSTETRITKGDVQVYQLLPDGFSEVFVLSKNFEIELSGEMTDGYHRIDIPGIKSSVLSFYVHDDDYATLGHQSSAGTTPGTGSSASRISPPAIQVPEAGGDPVWISTEDWSHLQGISDFLRRHPNLSRQLDATSLDWEATDVERLLTDLLETVRSEPSR